MTQPQPSLPHQPVMLKECLEFLDLKPGQWCIDGTFGAGGHTRALLKAGVNVLAIDQDPSTSQYFEALTTDYKHDGAANAPELKRAEGNFKNMDTYAQATGLDNVAGVLLDLGLSSMQLEEGRGFAFRHDNALDMRMSAQGPSAADLINTLEQDELAALIYKYGEERFSRRIARGIVSSRPIHTTQKLVEVIQRSYPKGSRRDHPARRTFQALRIAVNDELGALEEALAAAAKILADEGRLVVMSYHSLEDRIVKQTLRSSETLTPLTKKPVTASEEEISENPRARSAKLRAAVKRVQA